MKTGHFTLDIFINAPRARVAALATSFEHHDTLHPLIIAVRDESAEPPVVRRMWITDQLSFGPFSFKINYRTDILKLTDTEALFEVWQAPRLHIVSRLSFVDENGGTRLREEYQIESPSLIFGYVYQQAYAAHQAWLAALKKALEQ